MVRRVGFGDNKAPERQKPKPRPKRKIEKFHLEGAHDNDKPASMPENPQPAKPGRKPIKRRSIWFYLILGFWGLPMLVAGVFNFTNFLIYEVNIVPLTFFWVLMLGFGIFRLFAYLNKTLGLFPTLPDGK